MIAGMFASCSLDSMSLTEKDTTNFPKTAEDANSAWAKHLDASYAGVAADLGLMFKLGPAYVNAGCSTINFKYVDVSAGVGLFF